MRKIEYQKVYKIARKVRNYFEREWSSKELVALCVEVSDSLCDNLNDNGIEAEVKMGECYGCVHHWVEYKGNIIDLTITQFSHLAKKPMPEIFIKQRSRCRQYVECEF